MKFGKQLRDQTTSEWRFYSVDYKAMKKMLKEENGSALFFELLDESETKISKFYNEKEGWAKTYMKTMEERVEELRNVGANAPESSTEAWSESSDATVSSSDDDNDENDNGSNDESAIVMTSDTDKCSVVQRDNLDSIISELCKDSPLKDEYRRMGASKHFKAYIYAKKSLTTFDRELQLLIDFFGMNQTAFGKILKKFDKQTGSSIREQKLADLGPTLQILECALFKDLKARVARLLEQVTELKPKLPQGWESRKVYTIGCFDLFHRGHANVLMALREFGCYLVVGIHDDESYFKLKKKYTIDNLETRMNNVKPFADQIYVIPSTDPLMYIKSMVSEQDIISGACCYARGDDMLDFPARPWVESVMPVHFVPRTEACSSTLIRTIYHASDESLRKKAAFAKTRYDGKPIDEEGNVLKLSTASNNTVQAVS